MKTLALSHQAGSLSPAFITLFVMVYCDRWLHVTNPEMTRMILAYLGAAFLLGIAVGPELGIPAAPAAVFTSAAGVAVIGFWPNKSLRFVSLLLLALLLGVLRCSLIPPADIPSLPTDSTITITGSVVKSPVHKEKSLEIRLQARSIELAGESKESDAQIVIWLPTYEQALWGDELALTGMLQKPENIGADYARYLAGEGVYYTMARPKIERLPATSGLHPLRILDSFRQDMANRLDRVLPAPESGLLKGILLGDRSAMPPDLLDDFSTTGTTHIIAISGYNMTLIAGALTYLVALLKRRRLTTLVTLGGIGVYTVFVGANPAVVRAAAMGALWLIAREFGRERDAAIALVLTGCLMTALDPAVIWDIGFQLSFAAVAGLIYLSPLLSARLKRLPGILREPICATIAAQVMVFPVILHDFEQMPLLALPANLLAVPALPVVMVTGAIAAGAALIWFPLGQMAAWVAWLPLAYIIRVVEYSAFLPLASLSTPPFPVWLAFACYLAMAILMIMPRANRTALATAAGLVKTAATSTFSMVFLATTSLLVWLLVVARVAALW